MVPRTGCRWQTNHLQVFPRPPESSHIADGSKSKAGNETRVLKCPFPLPTSPFSLVAAETRETLGLRAGCAAQCIVALNDQLDMLLSALPADEGNEEALQAVLDALCTENVLAGVF